VPILMLHPNRIDIGCWSTPFFLNIPINCHLSSIQKTSCHRLLLPILPTFSPSPYLVIDSILSLVTFIPLLQRLRSPRLQSILWLLQFPIRFHYSIRIHFRSSWILGLHSPERHFLRTSVLLKLPTDCSNLPFRSSPRHLLPRRLLPLQLIRIL